MARLRGEVETTEAGAPASPAQHDKVAANVDAMRAAGAPDADIQAFTDGQAAA